MRMTWGKIAIVEMRGLDKELLINWPADHSSFFFYIKPRTNHLVCSILTIAFFIIRSSLHRIGFEIGFSHVKLVPDDQISIKFVWSNTFKFHQICLIKLFPCDVCLTCVWSNIKLVWSNIVWSNKFDPSGSTFTMSDIFESQR